jgi:hypothetical protein
MDEDALERLIARVDALEAELFGMRNRRKRFLFGGVAILVALGIGGWQTYQEAKRATRYAQMADSNASQAQSRAANAEMRASNAMSRTEYVALTVAAAFQPIVLDGRVTNIEGDAPVASGAACTVKVLAANVGELNCRVIVRCGDKLLYGKSGSGYLTCNMKDGLPTFGRDADGSARSKATDSGDPMFELDLPKERVVVSDGPSPAYSVEIALTAR